MALSQSLSQSHRHLGEQEGSAVVEFVFVSSLLIFLLLGVLQLGLVLHVRNTVQDAASEGARWAALADSSLAEGHARTQTLIETAVGAQYARDIQTGYDTWLGQPATVVTVRAPVPLLGLWGPPHLLEVSGHAAREVIG
jgi:Flp pilus assembly protein TadG